MASSEYIKWLEIRDIICGLNYKHKRSPFLGVQKAINCKDARAQWVVDVFGHGKTNMNTPRSDFRCNLRDKEDCTLAQIFFFCLHTYTHSRHQVVADANDVKSIVKIANESKDPFAYGLCAYYSWNVGLYDESRYWAELACQHNEPFGYMCMGATEKNVKQATQYYEKAAALGNVYSIMQLYKMNTSKSFLAAGLVRGGFSNSELTAFYFQLMNIFETTDTKTRFAIGKELIHWEEDPRMVKYFLGRVPSKNIMTKLIMLYQKSTSGAFKAVFVWTCIARKYFNQFVNKDARKLVSQHILKFASSWLEEKKITNYMAKKNKNG